MSGSFTVPSGVTVIEVKSSKTSGETVINYIGVKPGATISVYNTGNLNLFILYMVSSSTSGKRVGIYADTSYGEEFKSIVISYGPSINSQPTSDNLY